MIFHELINNITLLVTVILFFALVYENYYNRETGRHVFFGVIFGIAAIIGMNNSFVLSEGVVFDIRSVVLSIAALFGGPVSALISALMAASARLYLGGPGTAMGVASVLSSSLYGVLLYAWLKRKGREVDWKMLYFFGLVVNATVLLWTVLLPAEIRDHVRNAITWPILILYPLATLLLGFIIIHVKRNISERMLLQLNEQRFTLAMEASSDGLWEYIDDDTVYYSPTWKRMLGYGVDEIGHTFDEWTSLLYEADREKAIGTFAAFKKDPAGLYESVFRMRHKDGSLVHILSKGGAILDASGNIDRFIGTHTDITELKQFQEELQQLNTTLEKRVHDEVEKNRAKELLLVHQSKLASLGEMLVAISHHWRQPLTVIALKLQELTDLYDDNLLDRETLDTHITSALEVINQMSATIDDFRLFFEPSKRKEDFILQQSIDDVAHILKAEFESAGITLETLYSDADICIHGYKNRLKQAVLNILTNAKDAIVQRRESDPEFETGEGRVRIDVTRGSEMITIDITDNGGGTSAETIHQIFNPYFTTKEQGSGVGIGLYMSKIIIEKYYSGSITAVNDGDGLRVTLEITGSCR